MDSALLYRLIWTSCRKLKTDAYIYPPAEQVAIEAWEQEHHAKLPEGYKNWLLLSNGLRLGVSSAELFPLSGIHKITYQGEYYVLGEYIGDGSLLAADSQGIFYKLDHCDGLEECGFAEFMEEWVMERLEEYLGEQDIIDKDYGVCHRFVYHISDEAKVALLEDLASVQDNEIN